MPQKAIFINDCWFEYIYKNQNIVSGWLKYKLIYYLQKKNPNVPAIPFKLSAPYQRDLILAKKFWNEVKKQLILYDIYTDMPLTKDSFQKYGELSIDHFIPWSFVLHDELWNLIPTFKNINSSKGNKLPKLDLYLDKFCDAQYIAFSLVGKMKISKGFLEDYLTINKKLDLHKLSKTNGDVPKAEFIGSLKSTITPLFQIAYNQGYVLWQS
jgi:hypothetical protein